MQAPQDTYRELLKKASRSVKMGPLRILTPGLAGIGILLYGLWEFRLELLLMGALLLYISYQHFEHYRTAKSLLTSLEFLAHSFQRNVDQEMIE